MIRRFFLAGALAQPDMLSHVLGNKEQVLSPFSLPGYALGTGAFNAMLGLISAAETTTDGVLLTCAAEQAERLSFFAKGFKLISDTFAVDGQDITLFLAAPEKSAKRLEMWDSTQLPMLSHAIDEIMGYFGRYEGLCCINRDLSGLPLSPDGLILRAQ